MDVLVWSPRSGAPFHRLDCQWYQCKRWLSRQLRASKERNMLSLLQTFSKRERLHDFREVRAEIPWNLCAVVLPASIHDLCTTLHPDKPGFQYSRRGDESSEPARYGSHECLGPGAQSGESVVGGRQ